MRFCEIALTEENAQILIDFSVSWAAENSVYGYVANSEKDFAGNRIFMAYDAEKPVGYLFGNMYLSKNMKSIVPEDTRCFEVEEIYVRPEYRSQGVGAELFIFAENAVRDEADLLTLNTATKNWKKIFHFYIDELGMEFWSARLYKRL